MSGLSAAYPAVAAGLVKLAAGLMLAMALAVVAGRSVVALRDARRRSIERRYRLPLDHALAGDQNAAVALLASPSRHRLTIVSMLVRPLIDHRDPGHLPVARELARALGIVPLADRYLESRLWWRRSVAVRALGLLQMSDRTATIVAALDDPNDDVRAAALDALAELGNPESLKAIVVRLHDVSLHRGRRLAALVAFGSRAEPFLLELARVDPGNRANYADALALCGTPRSRRTLCGWTRDARPSVRAAAFGALARVGLDEEAARTAMEALDSRDEAIRAAAASALKGSPGCAAVAARLASHLDDSWIVAAAAAQTLRSMGEAGLAELSARAGGTGVAAALARQMLWEAAL